MIKHRVQKHRFTWVIDEYARIPALKIFYNIAQNEINSSCLNDTMILRFAYVIRRPDRITSQRIAILLDRHLRRVDVKLRAARDIEYRLISVARTNMPLPTCPSVKQTILSAGAARVEICASFATKLKRGRMGGGETASSRSRTIWRYGNGFA